MLQRFLLPLQFLALIRLFVSSEATSAADVIEVPGEVAGSVSVNCPTEPNKAIKYFYFQKLDPQLIFVNGFYTGHPEFTEAKANTRLDRERNTTVHLFNLTMDDSGRYECLLEYTDGSKHDTNVYINITANYSQPIVTSVRLSDSTYIVMCESHGGYPKSEPRWPKSEDGVLLHGIKSTTEPDQDGLFNINSTAYVNCSRPGVTLTCIIQDKKSEEVTVCQNDGKRPPWVLWTCVGLIGVVVVVVAVVLWFRCRKGNKNHGRTCSARYTAAKVRPG